MEQFLSRVRTTGMGTPTRPTLQTCLSQIRKYTGKHLATTLISFFWQSCYTLWNERCTQLHDPTSDEGGRDRQEIIKHICAMYDLQARVNSVDREILVMPLKQQLYSQHDS